MPGTTNFPAALDEFPDILEDTAENAAGFEHDVVHNNEAAAIAALQVKVGIDESEDAGSLDARVAALEGSIGPPVALTPYAYGLAAAGVQGASYSFTPTVEGTTEAIKWVLVDSTGFAPPAGTSLDVDTGEIAGTLSAGGNYTWLQVGVVQDGPFAGLSMPLAQSVVVTTSAAAWNPSDKNSSVTLSNSDRTAVGSGFPSNVRATKSSSLGAYYFEAKLITVDGSSPNVGISSLAWDIDSSFMGDSGNSYCLRANGALQPSGAGDYYATPAANDVVGVYADILDAGSGSITVNLWWSVNGTVPLGDPEAGTSPMQTFTTTSKAFAPCVSLYFSRTVTANFDPADWETTPTRFGAW